MKLKISPAHLLKLIKLIIKSNHKWLLIKQLLKGSGSGLSPMIEFFCGKRECYAGLIITNDGLLSVPLYSKIINGRVKEVGSLKLKNNKAEKAINELRKQLKRKGEVLKVSNYDVKRGVL